MKLKYDKRRLIIKGKEGKDYHVMYLFIYVFTYVYIVGVE